MQALALNAEQTGETSKIADIVVLSFELAEKEPGERFYLIFWYTESTTVPPGITTEEREEMRSQIESLFADPEEWEIILQFGTRVESTSLLSSRDRVFWFLGVGGLSS